MCIHNSFRLLCSRRFDCQLCPDGVALLIFTQSFRLAIDPVLRMWIITLYLSMQRARCLIKSIISVVALVGHRMCEWFLDKMEMPVPSFQAVFMMRFIQRNWIQLAFSLLMFLTVKICQYVSKAVDLYQIGSTLFESTRISGIITKLQLVVASKTKQASL